jgi:anti-sigma factor RsiW
MIRSAIRRVTMGRWPKPRPGDPLSCQEVGRLLQRYLDGELEDERDAESLSSHLEDCRRCGLEADTYRKIKAVLASRRLPVPHDSVERLREFGARLADGR